MSDEEGNTGVIKPADQLVPAKAPVLAGNPANPISLPSAQHGTGVAPSVPANVAPLVIPSETPGVTSTTSSDPKPLEHTSIDDVPMIFRDDIETSLEPNFIFHSEFNLGPQDRVNYYLSKGNGIINDAISGQFTKAELMAYSLRLSNFLDNWN